MEWAEPFTNLFAALDNYMVVAMHALDVTAAMQRNVTASSSPYSSTPPPAYLSAVERHKRFARDIMPFMHAVSQHLSSPAFFLGENTTITKLTQAYEEDMIINAAVDAPMKSGRRLLQATTTNSTNSTTDLDWKQKLGITQPWTEGIGAVQAYSSLVIAAASANPMVDTYADWLDGPFQWPPLDRTAMGSCPSAEAAKSIITGAFVALRDHFRNPKPFPKYEHQRINSTFPSIHEHNFSADPGWDNGTSSIAKTSNPIVSITAGLVKTLLTDVFGISMAHVVGFFTGGFDTGDDDLTMAKFAKTWLSCDFQSVVDCQKKRVNAITGAMAVILILALLYIAFGSIAAFVLGSVGILPMVLWYVYGYSPACIPMVPECVLQDVLEGASWLLPVQLTWPASLQKIPGCALDPNVPYKDCFIPCSAEPFRLVYSEPFGVNHVLDDLHAHNADTCNADTLCAGIQRGKRVWHGPCATGTHRDASSTWLRGRGGITSWCSGARS